MGPFSRDYGVWLDDGLKNVKNKIKNSSVLFATTYAWVLAIMTTTPSITKIIIVCTILISTLYHMLPRVTMRVESFAACLGNTIPKIFGMSTELWQFCPKAATIELWISLSCTMWNVFLAYVATKTNTSNPNPRAESFTACLVPTGDAIPAIFGILAEVWQFCPKAAAIELWISSSHT